MKHFCALLVLCLLWIAPIVAQTKTDKDRGELVGPVKSVEAYLINFTKKDNGIAVAHVEGKVAYAYDERRNEVERTAFNADGSLKNGDALLMNIDYDAHGNWTRKTRLIQSENDGQPQPDHAELRVITYYE